MLSFFKSLFGLSDQKESQPSSSQSANPRPQFPPRSNEQPNPQIAQALADAQAETPEDRLNLPKETVLERAAFEADMKNQVFNTMLGPTYKDWSVDLAECVIRFDCGNRLLSSPVQIVGTYDETDGSFLWGWDNPSVPVEVTKAALLAKRFGEKHGIADFSNPMVKCPPDQSWIFLAVALYLYGGQAAFEGRMPPQRIFFALDEVSIQKK